VLPRFCWFSLGGPAERTSCWCAEPGPSTCGSPKTAGPKARRLSAALGAFGPSQVGCSGILAQMHALAPRQRTARRAQGLLCAASVLAFLLRLAGMWGMPRPIVWCSGPHAYMTPRPCTACRARMRSKSCCAPPASWHPCSMTRYHTMHTQPLRMITCLPPHIPSAGREGAASAAVRRQRPGAPAHVVRNMARRKVASRARRLAGGCWLGSSAACICKRQLALAGPRQALQISAGRPGFAGFLGCLPACLAEGCAMRRRWAGVALRSGRGLHGWRPLAW
jgi:hypothetical protein